MVYCVVYIIQHCSKQHCKISFQLEIEAEKCLSKEKLDSCIKYTKLKIDNVCAFALRGFPKDCISNLDCPMKQVKSEKSLSMVIPLSEVSP